MYFRIFQIFLQSFLYILQFSMIVIVSQIYSLNSSRLILLTVFSDIFSKNKIDPKCKSHFLSKLCILSNKDPSILVLLNKTKILNLIRIIPPHVYFMTGVSLLRKQCFTRKKKRVCLKNNCYFNKHEKKIILFLLILVCQELIILLKYRIGIFIDNFSQFLYTRIIRHGKVFGESHLDRICCNYRLLNQVLKKQ